MSHKERISSRMMTKSSRTVSKLLSGMNLHGLPNSIDITLKRQASEELVSEGTDGYQVKEVMETQASGEKAPSESSTEIEHQKELKVMDRYRKFIEKEQKYIVKTKLLQHKKFIDEKVNQTKGPSAGSTDYRGSLSMIESNCKEITNLNE